LYRQEQILGRFDAQNSLSENLSSTPKPKMPHQVFVMAQEYFDEWMPLAASAQKGFLFFVSQQEWRDAAFILHQVTERLYHCCCWSAHSTRHHAARGIVGFMPNGELCRATME
jgi:hypothetical protein